MGPTNRNTAALFYFCKMYLALPSLQELPAIAGYSPRTSWNGTRNSVETNDVDSNLRCNPDALKYAWRILECMGEQKDLAAVWIPIVLFYASLVIWRTISLQGLAERDGTNSSLRVLQLFKCELEQMQWPCCKTMANVLQSLMV